MDDLRLKTGGVSIYPIPGAVVVTVGKSQCVLPGDAARDLAQAVLNAAQEADLAKASPERCPEFGDSRLSGAFWSRVAISASTGCWIWIGARNEYGYGRMPRPDDSRRSLPAHRVAYTALRGEIPQGLCIDHLCRNRACVNPDHLEPVTTKENVLRGESPSARAARRTECPQGHPYNDENTYRRARGDRECRTCQKNRRSRRAVATR